MDHINNSPHQLLKKDPLAKIKAKTLKQVKALKVNKLSNKKLLYHLKSTNSPAPRFYNQPKNTSKEFLKILLFDTEAPHCTMLAYTQLTFQSLKLEMKTTMPEILSCCFPSTTEMFHLLMMRKWYHLTSPFCTQTLP